MITSIIKRALRGIYYSLGFLLYYSGFLSLYFKFRFKEKLLIVFYHEVGNNQDVLGSISTKTNRFAEQVNFLQKHFNPISVNDLDGFFEGKRYVEYPFLLTFDGGYSGNYHNVSPIVTSMKIPCIIYIVTESIEQSEVPWTTKLSFIVNRTLNDELNFSYNNRTLYNGKLGNKRKVVKTIKANLFSMSSDSRDQAINSLANILDVNLSELNGIFMNWDMVVELNRSEFIGIGSHTLTHPRLSEVSINEATQEIFDSKTIIEKKLGKKVISFCYPDGKFGEDVPKLVEKAGYRNATTTINGINSPTSNPFFLKRLGGGNFPVFVFALKISGIARKLNV